MSSRSERIPGEVYYVKRVYYNVRIGSKACTKSKGRESKLRRPLKSMNLITLLLFFFVRQDRCNGLKRPKTNPPKKKRSASNLLGPRSKKRRERNLTRQRNRSTHPLLLLHRRLHLLLLAITPTNLDSTPPYKRPPPTRSSSSSSATASRRSSRRSRESVFSVAFLDVGCKREALERKGKVNESDLERVEQEHGREE